MYECSLVWKIQVKYSETYWILFRHNSQDIIFQGNEQSMVWYSSHYTQPLSHWFSDMILDLRSEMFLLAQVQFQSICFILVHFHRNKIRRYFEVVRIRMNDDK